MPVRSAKNLDETQKRQIRRGYYGTHHHEISDSDFTKLRLKEIDQYQAKALEMDKREALLSQFVRIFVVLFLCVAVAFALNAFSHRAVSDNTTTDDSVAAEGVKAADTTEPKSSDDQSSESNESGSSVDPEPGDDESNKVNCDSNYSGCVPKVDHDLDCADIGHSVEVYGDDPHGFDRDGDGYGCESY